MSLYQYIEFIKLRFQSFLGNRTLPHSGLQVSICSYAFHFKYQLSSPLGTSAPRPSPRGINFDCKLRRESIDVDDLLHAHIGGMDAMARGLKAAAALADPDGPMERLRSGRYASWQSPIGQMIEAGSVTLEELESVALDPR